MKEKLRDGLSPDIVFRTLKSKGRPEMRQHIKKEGHQDGATVEVSSSGGIERKKQNADTE